MRTSQVLLCVCVCILVYGSAVQGKGACKPTTLIMTRAVGDGATVQKDGIYKPKYDLNGVNLANINGALKYVITETIDKNSGVSDDTLGVCQRKNGVRYIHFYNVTFCNSNESLWWFNPSRPNNYFNEPAHDFKLFGSYLTFDGGQCHDSKDCVKIHGTPEVPNLKPWVGFQNQSGDPRNPTKNSFWYSIPGDCPLYKWGEKSSTCMKEKLSYRCKPGVVPNGDNCTWSYDFLGQVALDDLVGITKTKNNATGKVYKDYNEFCKAGNVEFERDPKNYSFVRGLDFWKDPLSQSANEKRIAKLLDLYSTYPLNKALPNLAGKNSPCYQSVRVCGDGSTDGTRKCHRDNSQTCQYCETAGTVCETLPSNWESDRFPVLPQVAIPKKDSDDDDSGGNKPSSSPSPSPSPGTGATSNGNRLHCHWAALVCAYLFLQ